MSRGCRSDGGAASWSTSSPGASPSVSGKTPWLPALGRARISTEPLMSSSSACCRRPLRPKTTRSGTTGGSSRLPRRCSGDAFAPSPQAFDLDGPGVRFLQDLAPLEDTEDKEVSALLIDMPRAPRPSATMRICSSSGERRQCFRAPRRRWRSTPCRATHLPEAPDIEHPYGAEVR